MITTDHAPYHSLASIARRSAASLRAGTFDPRRGKFVHPVPTDDLLRMANDAAAAIDVIHAGLAAVGRLMAGADDEALDAPAVRALGSLIGELAETAAECVYIAAPGADRVSAFDALAEGAEDG
ncbi:MAG: hypothetical protein K9L70_07915 [Thiohalocapsa sp.]|nr:hypothetical protein [Thiohalocapsa sp.]MCF7991581.1 hypothetical protein [Thiohalocapsa sp.]